MSTLSEAVGENGEVVLDEKLFVAITHCKILFGNCQKLVTSRASVPLKSGQAAASVQSHSVTVPSATPVAPEAARARWKYLEVCVTLAINRFTRKPAQNSRGFQIVLAGPR